MGHYITELLIWVAAAVLIGCIMGYLLKRLFASEKAEVEHARSQVITPASSLPVVKPPQKVAEIVEVSETIIATPTADPDELEVTDILTVTRHTMPEQGNGSGDMGEDELETVSLISTTKMHRPKGLTAARGGKPDDLQEISGIGPKNESILHNLGVYHFDQIAGWTKEQVAWVDDHLRFNGRIEREEWIDQARLLADGNKEEFHKRYGSGGLKTADGNTHAGSHTKRS